MSKKSKLDLLVRVRYLNPLPPPPFPPKLFKISTDIERLGEPSYLNHLAASTPLPMLVDSEMGMPLDLNAYPGVWDGDDSALNPIMRDDIKYDPVDLELLAPLQASSTTNAATKASSAAEVSWMRNSNLFTRKTAARRREAAEGEKKEAVVDASEAAQIMAIDQTFRDVREQDLSELRHPDSKKRHLRVVESYDILPDDESWSNPYIMIRFPERPSAATAINPSASASDGRLARSVIRPIRDEDQQVMEFYLPREEDLEKLDEVYDKAVPDEVMEQVRDLAEQDGSDPRIDEILPNVHYDRIRTYEVVSQTFLSGEGKEVLMSFVEDEEGSDRPRKKRKGVYFADINARTLLRKTRVKRRDEAEDRQDMWDITRLGYRLPGADEREARQKQVAQVTEPGWIDEQMRILQGPENMAEGLGEAINDESDGGDGGEDFED
ncbi:RNA polymerase II-associated [Naematelia encephala]|uniref:RNA polymerase II-associated n=1 Tax=Naematelia encephala TaxID=71784 RepID=A0A1Y2BLJ7_9TREE|nr:RNA polymerase II-associated [Naematelia encephala]